MEVSKLRQQLLLLLLLQWHLLLFVGGTSALT
jgi:hypothetical protein